MDNAPQDPTEQTLAASVPAKSWFWLIAICLFILVIIEMAVIQQGNLLFGQVVIIVIAAIIGLPGRPWRVPIKYVLRGSQLTTHGITGTRTVDLAHIAQIKPTIVYLQKATALRALQITDTTGGSTLIQLGAIAPSVRYAFCRALQPYLFSNPSVILKEKLVTTTFNQWAYTLQERTAMAPTVTPQEWRQQFKFPAIVILITIMALVALTIWESKAHH